MRQSAQSTTDRRDDAAAPAGGLKVSQTSSSRQTYNAGGRLSVTRTRHALLASAAAAAWIHGLPPPHALTCMTY